MSRFYRSFLLAGLAILFLTPLFANGQKVAPPPGEPTVPDSVLQQKKAEHAFEKPGQFETRPRHSADLEIDGLVVDETITKLGRDFYEIFFSLWEAPLTAKNFTILIKEMPIRGNGALVQVTVNEELIFEQRLQPRYDIIEELANYAVAVAYDFIANDQLRKQLEADGKKSIELF